MNTSNEVVDEVVIALRRLEVAASNAANAKTRGEEQVALMRLITPAGNARIALAAYDAMLAAPTLAKEEGQ